MDSGPLAPVGSVASLRFDDPDAFTDALRGGDVEYLPLGHGRFAAELTLLSLNDVRLQRATIPPTVTRGSIDRHSALLLLPLTPKMDPVVNGAALDEAHVTLLRPGDDIHAIVRVGLSWASVALDPDDMERLSDGWNLPTHIHRAPTLLGVGPAGVGHLRRSITAIADLSAALPELIATPVVATAMGKSLKELVAAMRIGPPPSSASYRRTAEMVRIMKAAEDYLVAHVMRPIYSEDLCQALEVSQRRLHAAFVAACGVSPQGYLKFRRLQLVRRALRSGGAYAGLVKSAALSHGFWHLGNFARDYRMYFGESPSETLQAARAAR